MTDVSTPASASASASTTVLRAARWADVVTGQIHAPAVVVIDGNRIVAVNPEGALPDSATVIDLGDVTLLPGLMDMELNLLIGGPGSPEGLPTPMHGVQDDPAYRTLRGAVNARNTIDAGFTTVRNLGDGNGVTLALRDAIRAGKVVGPNIVDAGRSISTTSGHMDAALGYREDFRDVLHAHDNLCDSAESCRRAVRIQVGRGVDVIKIATTGGVNSQVGAGLGQQMFNDEARASAVCCNSKATSR